MQSNQTVQNYTAQVCAGCADIQVLIDESPVGNYTLPSDESVRTDYDLNDGPVQISNSGSDTIVASQRVIYAGVSYSEMMGLPFEQLTNEYLFPYYNNVAMNSQLRVSNLGGVPTTITVRLGTDVIDSYTLPAGDATRINYPGANSGPLRVSSSATDILSTIRVVYANNSFSELMGFPADRLTQEYWYPVYDNVSLNSQLRVSNVGIGLTTITVRLGPDVIDSYTLAAGDATRINYTGMNSGPLHVTSSAEPILTTIRMLYNTSTFSSLYEMTGLPDTQLSTQYFFPWYNDVAMNSQLRFAVP